MVMNSSSDYLDGDIEQGLAQRIKAHLGICPPCNRFIGTLISTVQMLNTSPKHTAPQGFKDRIRDNLPDSKGG